MTRMCGNHASHVIMQEIMLISCTTVSRDRLKEWSENEKIFNK